MEERRRSIIPSHPAPFLRVSCIFVNDIGKKMPLESFFALIRPRHRLMNV